MMRFRARATAALEAVLFVLFVCFYAIREQGRRGRYQAVRWAIALAFAALFLGWWFCFLYRTPGG